MPRLELYWLLYHASHAAQRFRIHAGFMRAGAAGLQIVTFFHPPRPPLPPTHTTTTHPPPQVAELKSSVSGALQRFTSGDISADQLLAFLGAMGVELRCRWACGRVGW
jgi:hypothetical protein